MATWRKLLQEERENVGDASSVVAVAPDESVLDIEFNAGGGLTEGAAMLVWTEDRVYFPAMYDGGEWVASAPRNPGPDGMQHVGPDESFLDED
ncbi:hypothetical protein [Amycolatopsis sp. CA-230715]|uniref:hypothetical protein n=1 Tax=Amycolatopsis sp. CA-230715 TaxID=2745196 RepID=UPI001C015740|nr:hypothetical protein [Amycolatopsis sp. CA-230715]QWF81146.1 hypothetical protein HUW46_04572 [Amycolatopsis sp. CA-230715]